MTTKPGSTFKVWLTAVRPFAYTASVLPVLLGTALARYEGFPVFWGRFALALFGVVCFHTAANLLNDCFDYRRGIDREVHPASGAVVRGWLTPGQVYRAAILSLAAGTVTGILLVWLAGWMVLLAGLLGVALVLGYTRSGFCLKYAGWGDLAVFASFGILPVFGAWWVQTQTFSWQPVLWSLPMVSYTVAILHANNWRDIRRDSQQDCRTPAVRLGGYASKIYYQLLVIGPFAVMAAYLIAARCTGWPLQAPLTVLLTLLALPLSLRLAMGDWPLQPEGFAMLDAKTSQLHLLFSGLLTVGFVADVVFIP